ncbi:hypothetical protein [Salipiger bermudensis]|uniref:hypothetical protein n=1 Tax=Salipiger bermudensis TaxID=344736 RepID=UPI001CD5D10D|nr:hypothetical protein [Salipiger bermudensis]MCA0963273.1 hypothetical protein [Salipiger bermudensis]
MPDGIRVPDKAALSSADSFLAVHDGTVGLYLIASLATQLAGSGAVAEKFAELTAQITGGYVAKATWADLQAITPTEDGVGGEVLDSDGGTHSAATATGYDGASVSNAGRYSWNDSWGRWVWIGDTGLTSLAPLLSPALTGIPTAPTATAGDDSVQIATTAFVQSALAALIDAAPGQLDTLNELASALGDDPNFASTMTAELAGKVSIADLETVSQVEAEGGAETTRRAWTAVRVWQAINAWVQENFGITLSNRGAKASPVGADVIPISDSADGFALKKVFVSFFLGRSNHTGTQAISTVSGLQAALDAKASLAQGALGEEAGRLLQRQPARPELSGAFSSALTGADRAAITAGSAATNPTLGGVWRLDGADAVGGYQDIAPRHEVALEAGRTYEARFSLIRATNPADPSGHTVEIRMQNLSAARANVSNVRIEDLGPIVASDGVQSASFTFSTEVGADYRAPATARYALPYLRVYGGDHETDVAVIDLRDVTDRLTPVPQGEAEEGAADQRRAWSALRVKQAFDAFWVKEKEGLTKADLGLSAVDNTSDADKPVSTAQQAALDGKANTEDLVATIATEAEARVEADDALAAAVATEAETRASDDAAETTARVAADVETRFRLSEPSGVSLLTPAEAAFSDLAKMVFPVGSAQTVSIEGGQATLLLEPTPGGGNYMSLRCFPRHLFEAAGVVSASVVVLSAEEVDPAEERFLAIRQTASDNDVSVQVDEVAIPGAAVDAPGEYRVEGISLHPDCEWIDIRVRRDGGAMKIAGLVVASGPLAGPRPTNADRAAAERTRARGLSENLRDMPRVVIDFGSIANDTYDPRPRLTETGVALGASGQNWYVMRASDVVFEEGRTSEVTITAKKLGAGSGRIGIGVGPGGKDNRSRKMYVWQTDGRVQRFEGEGQGSDSIELLAAAIERAILEDDVISMRLRREADGTGTLTISTTGETVDLDDIPVGPVWCAVRNGSGGVQEIVEFQSVQHASIGALTGVAASAVASAAVSVPASFNRWVIPYSVYRQDDGSFLCDFDPALAAPFAKADADAVLYVDPVAGSDADAGTKAAPLQSLSAAVDGRTGNVMVIAKGGVYPHALSFAGATVAADALVIRSWDGARIVSSMRMPPRTWTKTSGQTSVYQASVEVDYRPSSGYDLLSILDASVIDIDTLSMKRPAYDRGDYRRLTAASDVADCDATAGSYFYDSSTHVLYVHTVDGRAADDAILALVQADNLVIDKASPVLWAQDVDFEGGSGPLRVRATGARAASVLDRCTVKYSSGAGTLQANGLNCATGSQTWLLKDCIAAVNIADGFNYHGSSPYALEVGCVGRNNGHDGGAANNGSTMHDQGAVVRVGCSYPLNIRNVHDINDSQSLNLGCLSSASRGDPENGCGYRAGVASGGSDASLMWLDTCISRDNESDLCATGGSIIRTYQTVTDGVIEAGSDVRDYEG